jgi:diketogulonate reductase-like aldo/keto reductase
MPPRGYGDGSRKLRLFRCFHNFEQGQGFEDLRAVGKIRAWGVSNFTVRQMEDLFHIPRGDRCATNQVLYNLDDRGIELDLLPWCEQHGMPVMAYSPLGGPGASLLRDPTLARVGEAHGSSAPPLRWPGPSAAATSLQLPNPVPYRM